MKVLAHFNVLLTLTIQIVENLFRMLVYFCLRMTEIHFGNNFTNISETEIFQGFVDSIINFTPTKVTIDVFRDYQVCRSIVPLRKRINLCQFTLTINKNGDANVILFVQLNFYNTAWRLLCGMGSTF